MDIMAYLPQKRWILCSLHCPNRLFLFSSSNLSAQLSTSIWTISPNFIFPSIWASFHHIFEEKAFQRGRAWMTFSIEVWCIILGTRVLIFWAIDSWMVSKESEAYFGIFCVLGMSAVEMMWMNMCSGRKQECIQWTTCDFKSTCFLCATYVISSPYTALIWYEQTSQWILSLISASEWVSLL
jgi:hypothetical protein